MICGSLARINVSFMSGPLSGLAWGGVRPIFGHWTKDASCSFRISSAPPRRIRVDPRQPSGRRRPPAQDGAGRETMRDAPFDRYA